MSIRLFLPLWSDPAQQLANGLNSLRLPPGSRSFVPGYTNSHPEVISQKRLIAELKSEKSDDAAENGSVSNPSYTMVLSKLADTELDIATYRSRLEEAQRRLEDAKKMTAKSISLQREYENLDRDYQVLQKNYEELVSRREVCEVTQAAGDQHGSFTFRLSPPRLNRTVRWRQTACS